MSWSVSIVGKPAGIVAALKDESARLGGSSKAEFDAALPHLIALVEQNMGEQMASSSFLIVELDATGSASTQDGVKVSGSCSVSLRSSWKKVAF